VTVDNGEAVVNEDGGELPEAPYQCFQLTPLVPRVETRVLRVWLHSVDRQGQDFRDISHEVDTQGWPPGDGDGEHDHGIVGRRRRTSPGPPNL
jgi:hypothetical protein